MGAGRSFLGRSAFIVNTHESARASAFIWPSDTGLICGRGDPREIAEGVRYPSSARVSPRPRSPDSPVALRDMPSHDWRICSDTALAGDGTAGARVPVVHQTRVPHGRAAALARDTD